MLLILIFFACTGPGCRQSTLEAPVIVWTEKRATGIRIPVALLRTGEADNFKNLQVFLQNSELPMLGEYEPVDGEIIFRPLIPLSPGKQYEVFYRTKLIARLAVPLPYAADKPVLMAFYPSADSLPENLLKFYLVFSSPMREGEALQHIHLLNEKNEPLPHVLLDLQPELWNDERTILTVWLDPGRIKRGLIPNRRMGNPLKENAQYSIVIDSGWNNTQGQPLNKPFIKKFFVHKRDDNPLQPDSWNLVVPLSHTLQPVHIAFTKPLDYFLLQETIQVRNDEGPVESTITLVNKETGMEFRPAKPWQPGRYRLRVATYLEDLSGNNLNKAFDRDITTQQRKDDAYMERWFVIEKGK